jgi:SAM-dependent methyltransferase
LNHGRRRCCCPPQNYPPKSGSNPVNNRSESTPDTEKRDALSEFFASANGHCNDMLYLNFRIYKKVQIWKLLQQAAASPGLAGKDQVTLVDVGASAAVDVMYALDRLTAGFTRPIPWPKLHVILLEGNEDYMSAGRFMMKSVPTSYPIVFEYRTCALVERLPVPDSAADLVICSEVVEHLVAPEGLLAEITRILMPGGSLVLTTDNSPSALQYLRRIPVWLRGRYREQYRRPTPAEETYGVFEVNGKRYELYGHISLNPTRHWERLGAEAGLRLRSFGSYESIRRGGGSGKPAALAFYFVAGWLNSLLPARLARFFGDSTILLFSRPPGNS